MTQDGQQPVETVIGTSIEVTRHRVTVTAATRRGKSKLRSAEWVEYEGRGEWWLLIDKQAGGDAYPTGYVRDSERHPGRGSYHGDLLRGEFSLTGRGEVVSIGRDVDVPLVVFRVICEAARGAGLHEIDVERLKAVVSQCGSRILELENLTDTQSQHAQELLIKQILSAL